MFVVVNLVQNYEICFENQQNHCFFRFYIVNIVLYREKSSRFVHQKEKQPKSLLMGCTLLIYLT